MEAKTNQPDVLALAFIHSADYKLVTILINKSDQEKIIRLPKMGDPGQAKMYLSTDTIQCALQKPVTGYEVKLPQKSIMTITWEK